MDLSGSWQCPKCNSFNDYEGNIKDLYFNGIKSKCENNPNGCTGDVYVYTDALEATRDFFWGKTCKATNITLSTIKLN